MPLLSMPRRVLAFALLLALAPLAARAASTAACGILVSTLGTDVPTCGLDRSTPCRTVKYGMSRAATEGLSCVFVQTGLYNEVLVLSNGIQLYGGFDASWQPGSLSDPTHQSSIQGGQDNGPGGAGEYLTVRAANLTVPARITDMILQGPNATGTVNDKGRSSYVVHMSSASLTLERVRLIVGNGAAGNVGAIGLGASSTLAAPSGSPGGAGVEQNTCNASSHGAGGPAGVNTCTISPSARIMSGGAGGAGGEMDTSCPFSLNATAGDAGFTAGFISGVAGQAGPGGPANSAGCGSGGGTPGGNGNAGFITNGAAGAAGSGSSISSGYWYAASGGTGATGQNGGGGGGGGGSGGCDEGTDSWGAGGGGGGAGGCAARGAGGGGGGGGGSFGVLAVAGSSVSLIDCQITRGGGGNGGSGGTGGEGQPGGAGGPGGTHPDCSAAGTGGAGAHGGHGGGGGGGQGGGSFAIAYSSTSTATSSGLSVSGGAAGVGGAGGVSAPSAPLANDDGDDGAAGMPGVLLATFALGTGPEPALTERTAAPAASFGAAGTCDISCFTLDAPGDGSTTQPLAFAGVSPNPVTRGSHARFSLPREARVKLEVFDAVGRRVLTLCDRTFESGAHTVAWNGRLEDGRAAANGIYVFRLEALGRTFTRRAAVLR